MFIFVLIIVFCHDIIDRNVGGIVKGDYGLCFYGECQFEQEEMIVNTHDDVKCVNGVAEF